MAMINKKLMSSTPKIAKADSIGCDCAAADAEVAEADCWVLASGVLAITGCVSLEMPSL
jgi:hypothetical protein